MASEEKKNILEWPSQSPDLNPIENMGNDVHTGDPPAMWSIWSFFAVKSGENIYKSVCAIVKAKCVSSKY